MRPPRSRDGQRGFAIALAVFLIITLAGIGAYLLTVSGSQSVAIVQDEQGSKAYLAARSGLDWGAYRLLRDSSCAAGPSQLVLTQGFFAEVTCQQIATEKEGAIDVFIYKITSTGCNNNPCGAIGVPTYVERQLELTLTRDI